MTRKQGDSNRFSIRYQFIILFFLLIAVPFLFVGYFTYHKSVDAIKNVNSVTSLEMIYKSGKNLDHYLNLVDSSQNELMSSVELQGLLRLIPQTKQEELEFITRLNALTGSVKTNPSGYAIRIFPIEPSRYPTFIHTIYFGLDTEKEQWFRQIRNHSRPFWHLFLTENNPILYTEPVLSKVKSLYDTENGRVSGIVLADIKFGTFKDYLSPLLMLDKQQIMLIGTDDRIMYHLDQRQLGRKVEDRLLLDTIRSGESDSTSVKLDGLAYSVTYTTLRNNDWKLVSMIPLSVLTAPISWVENVSILFLIFYLVLSIFVIVYITARFTTPIQRLVKQMRKVERGDFSSHPLQLNRSDEIGWLNHGFYHMVRRIEQLMQRVEKDARDKKELEFQVLTHQINPHFLYNTLESIRWKAMSSGAEEVSETVQALGNLLRLSLNDSKELTTVERELEHVKAYVKLHNDRSDTIARIVYLADEKLLRRRCLRLLLQPLVENSIKHGLRGGRTDGIRIVIKITADDSLLRFEVSDNGPGIPEKERASLLSDEGLALRRGVGLRNVNDRLKIYFGEGFSLKIGNGDHGGAVIELLHPLLADEETDQTKVGGIHEIRRD